MKICQYALSHLISVKLVNRDRWTARRETTMRFMLFGAIVISLSMLSSTLRAQTSQATIRGNVHDSTGAVVPGAKLVLENTATHVIATSVSNGAGDYLLQNINPGTYTLQVSKEGFSGQKLNPFTLVVNQTATLPFALNPGTVTEVVKVDAVGEGLAASTSELSTTLESKQVVELPLNGRNFTSLFTLAPGVSPIIPSGSQTASYTVSAGPVAIPSFNGQTNRSNLFLVDGILDIETFGNAYAVQPIIDVIQDQKLQSHMDAAEFGGSTGGTINISTKAGTNTLHGSAWEFNKSGPLQAQPYFTPAGVPHVSLSQNEFGGTVGGPVIIPKLYNGRNKTFFFGAYEGWKSNAPNTKPVLVPTPQQLAGDFTAAGTPPIYDPATTTCNGAGGACTRTQFAYNGIPNMIDPARLNQGNIAYAKYTLPAISTVPVVGGNAYEEIPTVQNYHQYDARADETIGQKDSMYFRIMGMKGTQTTGWSRLPTNLNLDAYQWVGSYVHIFSPTSVFHLQIGRTYLERATLTKFQGLPSNFLQLAAFDSDLIAPFEGGLTIIPNYSVSGYFGAGEGYNPEVTANSKSAKTDYTLVLGKHTFRTGAEFNKIGEGNLIESSNLSFISTTTGNLGTGITGNALASFMIGTPDNVLRRNSVESLSFGGMFGAYVQDQYQASQKLTLNLGVRWDYAALPTFGTPHNNNQAVGNMNTDNGTYIVYKVPGSCASTNNIAPCIPTPDGSLPAHVVASPDGRQLQNTPFNIQPRIGAAYRITPTTVIRTGFGMAFDEYAGMVQNIRGLAANWPSVGQLQHASLNTPTATTPFPNVTPQNLPGLSALPAPTPFKSQNWYIDPNLKDAYSYQWNLGVQRQLSRSTVATVTYVGSSNHRLSWGGMANVPMTPGPGDPTARAPFPYMTRTYYAKSNQNGSYNALQAQLTRSFDRDLAATVAYTWGKSIDVGCSGFFGAEGCDVQQYYNPRTDRSVSAFDVPQHLAATWLYGLPIGRGKLVNIENSVLNVIAGGWQINGILQLSSGTPYAVHLNADIANLGYSGYERANVVGSSVPANRTAKNWLNPAGFAAPANYTYGNMGRNSIRSQFFSDLDASLSKEVKIKERMTFQFRAEAFNLPNQHVFAVPNSTLDSPNFGVISNTRSSSRSFQLVGKVLF